MEVTATVEGTKVFLLRKTIAMPDLFGELQKKYKSNPYFEYMNHPIIAREVVDGKKYIMKYNPILQEHEVLIKCSVEYSLTKTDVTFYIELI